MKSPFFVCFPWDQIKFLSSNLKYQLYALHAVIEMTNLMIKLFYIHTIKGFVRSILKAM